MTKEIGVSFRVDHIPKSLNSTLSLKTRSYHQYNRYKQDWKTIVQSCVSSMIPSNPIKSPLIKITRYYYRFLDYDNLVGSMKPLVDGLVSCRIIEDDNYETTGQWDVSQEKVPKKDGGYLEVIVTSKE